MKLNLVLMLFIQLLFISSLFATDEEIDLDAIKSSQDAIVNGQNDPATAAAFSDLRKMGVDSKTEQEILMLVSSIMGTLGTQVTSGADLEKLLNEGKTDPQGFAKKFTPEQRAKLKEIADKLDAQKKK